MTAPVLTRRRYRATSNLTDAVNDRTLIPGLDSDACWQWQGFKDRNGYGFFRWRGTAYFAHRASWIASHGPIPEGLSVLHRCDVPDCVRPSHLFLGTQADNIADAKAKGRLATGERGLVCKRGHSKALYYRRYPSGARGCEECRRVRRAEAKGDTWLRLS